MARNTLHTNLVAVISLTDLIRPCIGPNGVYKLISTTDKEGLIRECYTKQPATILNNIQLNHPAAILVSQTCKSLQKVLSDGATTFMTFLGSLLREADKLIHDLKLAPPLVSMIFREALDIVLSELDKFANSEISDLKDPQQFKTLLHSSLHSKQIQVEILADLLFQACFKFESLTDATIVVLPIVGREMSNSSVIEGLVVPNRSVTNIKRIENCKILIIGSSLGINTVKSKQKLVFETAEQLQNYREDEEHLLRAQAEKIRDLGVNTVIINGKFHDLLVHYFNRFNILAIDKIPRDLLHQISKLTNANIIYKMADFKETDIGSANRIVPSELLSGPCSLLEASNNKVVTVMLSASSQALSEEIQRVSEESLKFVKNLSSCLPIKLVTGGGSAEFHIARKLREHAAKSTLIKATVLEAFAEACLSIPRTLAENAGSNVYSIIEQMERAKYDFVGINEEGNAANMSEMNVFDVLIVKKHVLRSAVEMALMLLKSN